MTTFVAPSAQALLLLSLFGMASGFALAAYSNRISKTHSRDFVPNTLIYGFIYGLLATAAAIVAGWIFVPIFVGLGLLKIHLNEHAMKEFEKNSNKANEP